MSDQRRRDELGQFFKSRRARLRPADVGLPMTPRRRVQGLRREEVAALANIGVSWYTALENGDASGVSAATLSDIADALRLDDSERHYVRSLASDPGRREELAAPSRLEVDALMAIGYPAYIITAGWTITTCNDAFRLVWGVDDEPPIDVVTRLYFDPRSRIMHGDRFAANVAPVVAMVRSGMGRNPHIRRLFELRDLFVADEQTRPIWDAFEISSPLARTSATVTSSIGTYTYETLTLPIGTGFYGIVVEVPDAASRERLACASRAALAATEPRRRRPLTR